VTEDGTPADPAAYDYDRAARDALTFTALFDRFIQNLRRYLGYDAIFRMGLVPVISSRTRFRAEPGSSRALMAGTDDRFRRRRVRSESPLRG